MDEMSIKPGLFFIFTVKDHYCSGEIPYPTSDIVVAEDKNDWLVQQNEVHILSGFNMFRSTFYDKKKY